MQRLKSAPSVDAQASKPIGVNSTGTAATRIVLAVACLLILVMGIFAMDFANTRPDPPAHGQDRFQDQPSGLSTTDPERSSPVAGAQLTDSQQPPGVSTTVDDEPAGCRSCDARHRNLIRLKQTQAP